MALPQVVSPDRWLAARKELLAKEKEAARALAAVTAERARLPMTRVAKEYAFEGPEGEVGLLELFDKRSQLIIYHFMFDPAWDEGCKHCSYLVDNIGHLGHFHARDTTVAIVSRAPQAKIGQFKSRMGWSIPWYSSHGSDFNYDFHVTLDETVTEIEYGYKDKEALEQAGETYFMSGEQGGLSVFVRDGDAVFHTYSAYAEGNDLLHGADNYLDLTPLGRQDSVEWRWWLQHHDQYTA